MTRKAKKQTVGIIIAVALLIIAVAVLAYLNMGDLSKKKELESNAEFILQQGDQKHQVAMADILALKPIEFTTIMRTGTTGPTEVSFKGVELSKVLEAYKIEVRPESTIEVNSLDGYSSAFKGEEVLENENVYITIAMNGESLKPKSEGGLGPYYLILRKAEFAQRWVKFMEEIVVR